MVKEATGKAIPNPFVPYPATLSSVAEQFGLATDTIIWSNWEVFRDVPWRLRAGTELFILPIDGAYHTVDAGETVASIAASYSVESAALFNEWNDFYRGNQPRAGQRLVIPGGKGEEIDWQPLVTYPAPGPDKLAVGTCDTIMVIGPSGHGWFTYPTARTEVSGWGFNDPRHPSIHIGVDYDCAQGDPIYAADSGVVTMAGLNGTYGYMVEINHGGGFVTRYGHLGTIDVKEIVAIHDVGRAINPVGVEGQIEGGVAMGVGYALQEEVKLKDDGQWTDSFTEYLLPTTLDTPRITPIILEYPEPSGPYGAKGVGEAVVGPVAPAIANAVADATGVRVTSLPIRPEALVAD